MNDVIPRLSLTRKLMLINLTVVGFALLAASLAYLWMESNYQRQNLSHAITSQAKLIANNSLAALSFRDQEAAEETLSALNSVREVMSAALIDESGSVFASYQSDYHAQDPEVDYLQDGVLEWPDRQENYIYSQGILHVLEPVTFDGEQIGEVYIRTSLLPFREQQTQRALIVGMIYLSAFGLAALAFHRLQKVIIWPVGLLSRIVERVASSNDYSLRVYYHSSDEIGALARGFNEMLNEIQKRDVQLKEYSDHLSHEVARQTAELRESNEELARTVVALQKANETIREKERSRVLAESREKAKAEFLAHMSHELRTPMNGVLGMLSLLRETRTDTEQVNYIDVATESATHLLNLLDDILDYSKIEAGQKALEYRDFNLQQTIDEVLELLGEHALAKGVELASVQETPIPTYLVGDAVRVKQLVTNLVGNAVKFTSQGYIRVSLKIVEETSDTIQIELEVEDSGIGIPESSLARVFEAFAQVDSSTTRRFGGTGLGLALCKRIAEDMNGSISLTSKEGIGSRFTLLLPFRKSDIKPVQSALDQQLEGLTAWVLSSRKLVCESLCQRLQRLKLDVRCLTSVDALEHNLALGQELPDFVFADVAETEMAALEALGQKLRPTRTHFILVGSHNQKFACVEAIPDAYDGFLVKPFRRKSLLTLFSQFYPTREAEATDTDLQDLQRRELGIQKFRLLVVEDNLVNQKVAKGRLSKLGHEVALADNGRQAISLLEKNRYDLIFMDCQMPVMDGYQAAREIRERKLAEDTPIVAMTAHALPGDRQRCLEAGMNDYLAKPVTQEVFLGVLHHWLIARHLEQHGTTTDTNTTT